MRTAALILNVLTLTIALILVADIPYRLSDEQWVIFVIIPMILTTSVNMYALTNGKDNWVTLYFKRKALEEKKKIESLNQDKDSE